MDDNNNYHNRGNSIAPESDLLLINHCQPNTNQNTTKHNINDNALSRSEYVIIHSIYFTIAYTYIYIYIV